MHTAHACAYARPWPVAGLRTQPKIQNGRYSVFPRRCCSRLAADFTCRRPWPWSTSPGPSRAGTGRRSEVLAAGCWLLAAGCWLWLLPAWSKDLARNGQIVRENRRFWGCTRSPTACANCACAILHMPACTTCARSINMAYSARWA